MALTPAEKSRRHRNKQLAAGLIKVTVFVPATSAAEFHLVAEATRARPELILGPLRDSITGRLVSAKFALRNNAGGEDE